MDSFCFVKVQHALNEYFQMKAKKSKSKIAFTHLSFCFCLFRGHKRNAIHFYNVVKYNLTELTTRSKRYTWGALWCSAGVAS